LVGARTIARVRGAHVRLVEVLDAMWMGTPALMSGPGYILTPEDAEERAHRYLAEVVSSLTPDVKTEPVVIVGAPERILAEESEAADLMVVGSRGYGPHRAVLVGSVSGRLVRESACPVIVVPRGIEAPLEELFGADSRTQAI
jgi:nucleotide-binding universal stress UspA family protein